MTKQLPNRYKLLKLAVLLGGCLFLANSATRSSGAAAPILGTNPYTIYLPIAVSVEEATLGVNAPYFDSQITVNNINQTAIFWFGKVTPTENYADVRVGYTDDSLTVRLNIFDRQVWYDTTPSIGELTSWDAAELYLNLGGNSGNALTSQAFKFVGQIRNTGAPADKYQAAYQGSGGGWQLVSIPYTISAVWIGGGLNSSSAENGWAITYNIPFSSLGLSGAPASGSDWGMGLYVYDRDDASGTPIPSKTWPTDANSNQPSSWGRLSFGFSPTSKANLAPSGSTTLRNGLNGVVVKDGMVGGQFNCGEDYYQNTWELWGNANYFQSPKIIVQNQFNLADWPCFSKYFLTFPLDSLPDGAQILSAELTMYHWGNSGMPGDVVPASLLQVLTVASDWDPATLTWNNAPLALENVSQTWVEPLPMGIDPTQVPITWDITGAVAETYAKGTPLRLAIYSADVGQHSGKYFYSSYSAYNEFRPTLVITWGQP